ncbi:hypothetical protein SAMN03159512_04708 [Pseudomonas sp. NFR09]|nr:hypothetical protein SAMN03159512_04708 [Pseudomonas sp. NFR09]
MKNQQDNTGALPALLRTAGSVDTLETNSICCAAAGIIAPSSATAEALIPHEKLRGAALADATLNAQKRPLAQPVVVYKRKSKIALTSGLLKTSVCREATRNIFNVSPMLLDLLSISRKILNVRPKYAAFEPKSRFERGAELIQIPFELEDLANYLQGRRYRDEGRKVTSNSFQISQVRMNGLVLQCRPIKPLSHLAKLPSNCFCDISSTTFLLKLLLTLRLAFYFMGTIRDRKRTKNSPNRSNRLDPSSGCIGRPLPKNQDCGRTDEQCTRRRDRSFVNRADLKADQIRKHQWLLAIFQSLSLNTFPFQVHGGGK